MNHGLSHDTVAAIHGVLGRFPEVARASLYGSRARGNFKQGSDIDLTLHGKKLTPRRLAEIEDALDDLLLPYTIDLSVFDRLPDGPLRRQIEQVGREFYRRQDAFARP